MRPTFFVAMFLFVAGTGWAFDTGNEFLKECGREMSTRSTNTEMLLYANCVGYVSGISHGMQIAPAWRVGGKEAIFCPPRGSNTGQFMRITVKWMNDHPELLHEHASVLIFFALLDAFACPEELERIRGETERLKIETEKLKQLLDLFDK